MKNIRGHLLILLIRGLSRLSWKTLYNLSDGIRWLVFDVAKYRKKVILDNLERSFPQKSESERNKIERDFQSNLIDSIVKVYWTTFLNQKTGMYSGVELITRKFNSPVVYAKIERNESKRGHYKVVLDLICDNPSDMPQNCTLEKQASLLEADIRQQPVNWLWSHTRWKHPRPAHLESSQLLEYHQHREQKTR